MYFLVKIHASFRILLIVGEIFVSQQMRSCVFRCVASAAHFLILLGGFFMKRLISLLIVAVMTFATFSAAIPVSAETVSGTCGDNLTWDFDTETGTLTVSGTGAMTDYNNSYNSSAGTYITTAPWKSYYDSIKTVVISSGVTSIGGWAFDGCSSLVSVTIPDSVTEIGSVAFTECTSLTSITIPDSVTSIGEDAFSYCSSLTSITIPDGVTSIGSSAFSYCTSLTSITIPDSVTSIGYAAFFKCSSLTSITIPDSVTSIGYNAFSNCTSLTSITIPDSVTSIGYNAFSSCSSLERITVDTGNPVYHSDRNCLIETETKTLVLGCKNSIIPSDGSVTSIGHYAFCGCFWLTSITIPDSVTSIGVRAFSSCSSLTSITIPDSVTSIGGWAFEGCSSLTSITIPDGVTSIGDYAFSSCYFLTSITIPGGVTSIGNYAFESCTSLTSVTIPDSVTEIGEDAFYGCSKLTSVTIGNSVTSIGDYAFYGCSSLTSITIPDGVTWIGWGAFSSCRSLSDVYYIGTEEEWNEISVSSDNDPLLDATIHFAGDLNQEFSGGKCGTNLTWKFDTATCTLTISGTGAMTDYNYSYNSSAGTLITTGPWKSYYDSIKTVVISFGVTSIGEYAFYNCSSLTSVTIGNSVTSIGYEAFSRCTSLTSITIPDSVTSIGSDAFSRCSALESITVDTGNPIYHSDGNCLIETETKTLIAGCKNSIIPSDGSVTSIGGSAFDYCTSLTSITIPDSVTSIGDEAFEYCYSLTSVTIGNSVTSIGAFAFYYCSSLTSITIPDSVTSIGTDAFSGCSSLSDVCYIGTEEEWNEISVGNYNNPLLNANIHFVDPTLEYSSSNVSLESSFDAAIYGAELIVEKDAAGGNVSVIPSKYDSEGAIVYDIYLEKDGKEVQPSGEVTVKIPVPEGMKGEECKVFRITDDEAVDMNAEYADGYLVFKTDHFSYYAVVQRKPSIALKGDINKDDDVTMKDVLLLRRYIAGLSELDEDGQRRADINADDDVTMKDVLKLRRIIAGLDE